MGKYLPEEAREIINDAVDKALSKKTGWLCVHRNILGLKRLGAVDYLKNKCHAPVKWIGEK